MGTYYSLEYANLWMGIKETAFRTNAQGLDTANAVDSAFRRFPIKWEGAIAPQPLRYVVEKKRSAGKGLDYSNVYRNGYADVRFSISGEVLDFAFLYQLCGLCTTAGSYTHTVNIFQSAHASYATNTPTTPTFQMLQKIANVTSAENKYVLYVGCKITDFICYYNEASGRVFGTLTIEVANTIAGTALTTEPAWITDPPYYFNPKTGFAWTGYTGPHTYAGYCAMWTFHFNNGQSLRKPNHMVLPDMVISNFRTVELDWTWVTEELDDFDDSQRDMLTDLDQDLVHTLNGGDGNDSLVMTWSKMAIEHLGEDYKYKDFYLARRYRAVLNPALATSSTLVIVETNSADNTYYEGS
jgi:hypothetical protein